MRYLSVCSGIEAASVAWHPLGWIPVGFSEIEAFPSSVLAHHYPATPNFGDLTRYAEWPELDARLVVGGTPCQSFSVAGLRRGMADPRGNLALVFLGLVDRTRPDWMVWENVPGVLSSNGGKDFGAFLGGLGELGYGVAYRVLDAQYFGVAQRRRRVFVVGYLGDWRAPAAVLFERESLSGNPPPSRAKGERVTGTLASRSSAGGGLGTDLELDGGLVPSWPAEISPTLNACFSEKQGLEDQHALGGGGMFVPHTIGTITARMFNALGARDVEEGALLPFVSSGLGQFSKGKPTLRASGGDAGGGSEAVIAFGSAMSEPQVDVDLSQAVQAKNRQAVAFTQNQRDEVRELEVAGAISADQGMKQQTYVSADMVRRLTPRECERLQGFPDDYTLIPHRGRLSADGPRYKALGNSMAVPVMHWIGRRIDLVDRILKRQGGKDAE